MCTLIATANSRDNSAVILPNVGLIQSKASSRRDSFRDVSGGG